MSNDLSKIKLDRFRTIASYLWQACDVGLRDDDIADALHLMCPQTRTPELGRDINTQMAGVVADVSLSLSDTDDLIGRWRRAIANIKASDKLFDFWATFEGERRADGRGYTIKGCQMSREEYDYMMQEIGDQFLGWEIGEWDGLYARDVVQHWTEEEKPKNRRDGHALFMSYIRRLHDLLYGNTNALCGLPYAHYFNELPVRMVGAETAQGLLNTQLYVSSLRGACLQYGMEFKLISSIFDRWGHTDFTGKNETVPPQLSGQRTGEYEGHSLGLFYAQWLTGYLAGSSLVGLEGAFYTHEVEDGRRKFSPIGQAMHDFTAWSRNPHPRGKQIRPLALMMDYYAGWAPPRHYYSSIAECVVWHAVPYGPSDYAMDRAYHTFYPGYLDSGFYRDERGFITPTPCGDAVDILLNDASVDDMAGYPVIWLLTDESLVANFISRLKSYVESGGHLIVGGSPMVVLAKQWFAIDVGGERREGVASFVGPDDQMLREAYYTVNVFEPGSKWTIHAKTEKNDPLILSTSFGQGKVSFITSSHGLTDEMALPVGSIRQYDPQPPHQFELLHAVEQYVKGCVDEYMPVQVTGKDIYYAVNELDGQNLILCLYNPSDEMWEGYIDLGMDRSFCLSDVRGPWSGQGEYRDNKVRLPGNETMLLKLLKQ